MRVLIISDTHRRDDRFLELIKQSEANRHAHTLR